MIFFSSSPLEDSVLDSTWRDFTVVYERTITFAYTYDVSQYELFIVGLSVRSRIFWFHKTDVWAAMCNSRYLVGSRVKLAWTTAWAVAQWMWHVGFTGADRTTGWLLKRARMRTTSGESASLRVILDRRQRILESVKKQRGMSQLVTAERLESLREPIRVTPVPGPC